MALLADKSADVGSNLVQGQNTQSLTFTMPGGVAIKVLSVVATINNGAAVAVTPELTIKEASGAVIATKRQGSTIPAGDTGRATFALRLAADGSSTGTGGIQFDTDPQTGVYLWAKTTGFDPTNGNGMEFNVTGGNDFRVNVTDDTAVILDVNDGDGELLLRHNKLIGFIDTGEGFQFLPGKADFATLQLSIHFEDSTKTMAYKIPAGGTFAISKPTDSLFGVGDTAGQGSVNTTCGLFTVQTAFPHTTFFEVRDAAGTKTITATTDTTIVKLKTGGKLEVQDNGGNPIFRVDEDGDLHGLTGKALVFDL